MRRVGESSTVLGQGYVHHLVAAVVDLDLGIVAFWKVDVVWHSFYARRSADLQSARRVDVAYGIGGLAGVISFVG